MRAFVLTILLLPGLLFAQDHQKTIESLMQQAAIPGLSLAYIKNGKLQSVYHLGLRNADSKVPVDPTTVFAAASLSKSVFAYGVWKLIEAGKINLDTPLYRYLEYEDLKHDARYKLITARQVLSHTSGLPNWRNGPQLNFRYDPGTRYSYSGEGFVFLQKVVEKITGMPIEPWMQQTVLQPLGMKNSSYLWQTRFETDYAQPHNDVGRTAPKFFPTEANMAHSLQTTAADFSLLLLAIFNNKQWKKLEYQSLFNPQPNSRFKDYENSLGWGLGLGYAVDSNKQSFWQWGDNGTYKAFVIGYPSSKDGLVYFTNSSNGLAIAPDLLALFFAGKQPALQWLGYTKYNDARFQLQQALNGQPFAKAIEPYMDKSSAHQDTSRLNESNMNGVGFRLLRLRRLEEALTLFEMNLRAYPGSASAMEGIGASWLRMGKTDKAKQALNAAYQLDTTKKNCIRAANLLAGKPDTSAGINSRFRLEQYADAKNVQLTGSFNGWNDLSLPMRWENGGWTISINLPPGTHLYKFIVDGIWISDPRNPMVKTDDNLNSVLEVKGG